MARSKSSSIRRYQHRKTLIATKGFRLLRNSVVKRAKEALLKSGPYAYVHRKNKKRLNRRLWNLQINAAARLNDTKYSVLIAGLKAKQIELDRKVLSQIAQRDAAAFTVIVAAAK